MKVVTSMMTREHLLNLELIAYWLMRPVPTENPRVACVRAV